MIDNNRDCSACSIQGNNDADADLNISEGNQVEPV